MESLRAHFQQPLLSPTNLMQPDRQQQYRGTPEDVTQTAEEPQQTPGAAHPGASLSPDDALSTMDGTSSPGESPEQEELRRLRLENEYLRKQRDLYRKAAGVVGAHVLGGRRKMES